MRIDPYGLGASARTVSEAGAFLERATHAAKPSVSSIARVGAAISALRLGARLFPAGRRLLERYPVVSALAVAGLIAALYSMRSRPSRGALLARSEAGTIDGHGPDHEHG